MTAPPDDIPVLRFSTNALPERDRLPYCREVFGRMILRNDLEPVPGSDFHITTTMRTLPGISFWASTYSPIRIRRTPELLSDGNDDIGFCTVPVGHMRFAQFGDERKVGDCLLGSVGDAYSVTTTASLTTVVGVLLPRRPLADMVPGLNDALACPLSPDNEALKLLKRYVGVLADDQSLATPALRQLVVIHIYDLVGLALGATRDAAAVANGRGVRAARLHAIKTEILNGLNRPGLSLASLAARHGVTPRHVQMLFESDGTTFSRFRLDQRLARAYRMLSDPRLAERTISAIAYEAGFGDVSHFNRAFRRRYGETPSDLRAGSRHADWPTGGRAAP
jgi:AraC-like DNA-binding protein